MPSTEKVQQAQKFQLPDTFYNYELHTCSGCIGCDNNEFDFSTIGQARKSRGDFAQYASSTYYINLF